MTNLLNGLRDTMATNEVRFDSRWLLLGKAKNNDEFYADLTTRPGSVRRVEKRADGRCYVIEGVSEMEWTRPPVNLEEQLPEDKWGTHSATSTQPMSTIIATHRVVTRLGTNRDRWIKGLVERELKRLDKEWSANLFRPLEESESTPAAYRKKRAEIDEADKALSTTQRVQGGSLCR